MGLYVSEWLVAAVMLIILPLYSSKYMADAASTSMSCPSRGCQGHSYNITCDILGNITSGITWRNPDGEEVVTCLGTELCQALPGYRLAVETAHKHILEVTKFSAKDSGRWTCRDGIAEPTHYCDVTGLVSPGLSHLSLSCIKHEETFLVSCTGLKGHGSPPVELQLNSTTIAQSMSTGMLLTVDQAKLNGEMFQCSVSGVATECLPSDVTLLVYTSCPGPSCISVNTYMIVFELIMMIAGLFNLLVLYLGRQATGQEEMVDKSILWILGIMMGALLLLLGTVHAILLAQFCIVATSLPIAGAFMGAAALLIGLGLLIISVLQKVFERRHCYDVPEDLKARSGGNTTTMEDTDELEEDSDK